MKDQNNQEQNHYLGARIYGSVMEYAGIVSGVSAGVSAFQNGFDVRKISMILAGVTMYTIGKIYNYAADRSAQIDELSRRGLEETLQNPQE